MSATALSRNQYAPRSVGNASDGLWLRDRRWDLLFITFSVFLVPIPYLFYVLGKEAGLSSDFSRNMVNGVVAVLVGGPHMYATFLRTNFDRQFVGRYPMLVRTALVIPVVVLSLAFLNLTLLLAIFFFWALVHVLHQATYIVELYYHRENQKNGVDEPKELTKLLSKPARIIDYMVIMTSMAPVAAYKISQGAFAIGTNDLMAVIPGFFQQLWVFVLLSAVFVASVLAFLIKTAIEIRGGYVHWPKTAFIVITAAVSFTVPALPNLDTAFQGMNTWHSFQYLVLTFYILKLRQQTGYLEANAPFVDNIAKQEGNRRLYVTSLLMGVASIVVAIVIYAIAALVEPANLNSNQHFDAAYYSGILVFLWIHYYYDHFLFTDFEALD